MAEFNLPDDVNSSMLPGNSDKDIAWSEVCDELNNEDILNECDKHQKSCMYSSYEDGEFLCCSKGITSTDEVTYELIIWETDPLECPFVEILLERRMEDRLEGCED